MALNNEDESDNEIVKRIARITGETQAQAVFIALNERLARLQKAELAARLLAIGRKTAVRLTLDGKRLDHGALLYDDRGRPS